MKAAVKAAAAPVSDYEFVRKMLDKVAKIGRGRRLMPDETRLIEAIRERWTTDGQTFAMAPSHRDNLTALVGRIEVRLKTVPYPRFY